MKYSATAEETYYAKRWPTEALPYHHLEPYISSWLPEATSIFTDKTVLDIGAGEATYTRLLAEIYAPRRVVACDLFARRMTPAKRANQLDNVSFVAGSCFSLPFPDQSFETVFASLVLSQLPDLDEAIAEIDRVLKPNGYYVGIEPNPHSLIVRYRFYRGRHSRNQFLFKEAHLSVFRQRHFNVDVRYFFGRFPRIRDRWRSTCMGIVCRKGIV